MWDFDQVLLIYLNIARRVYFCKIAHIAVFWKDFYNCTLQEIFITSQPNQEQFWELKCCFLKRSFSKYCANQTIHDSKTHFKVWSFFLGFQVSAKTIRDISHACLGWVSLTTTFLAFSPTRINLNLVISMRMPLKYEK